MYCFYVDGGWDNGMTHDGDKFSTLFTDDAVMEFPINPEFGESTKAVGKEAIRQTINAAQVIKYASHNMCGEMIDIDGDKAHATWHCNELYFLVRQNIRWHIYLSRGLCAYR